MSKRSIEQWFSEYAESHQNPTNQRIHFICVPLIFFSIVGLFMSIPNGLLIKATGSDHLLLSNWAIVAMLLPAVFYLRLSLGVFMQMIVFATLCMIGNFLLSAYVDLLWMSLILFALAWIGQFYGHHIEKKKPSFLKDLQFLLIGPAWVFEKVKLFFK